MLYSFGDTIDFYSGQKIARLIEESSKPLEKIPFRECQRKQMLNFLQGYKGINDLAIYSFVRRN